MIKLENGIERETKTASDCENWEANTCLVVHGLGRQCYLSLCDIFKVERRLDR